MVEDITNTIIKRKGSVKNVVSKKRFSTSKNNGHRHSWRFGDKRTSIDSGHSHSINFKKKIAEKGKTNHIHKLLRVPKDEVKRGKTTRRKIRRGY